MTRESQQRMDFFVADLLEYPAKVIWSTPLPPPSTCSAAEPTHPTAAQGHNISSHTSAGTHSSTRTRMLPLSFILAGERRSHTQRRLSHRDETHCLPRRAPWRAPVVQEEGQRSCCAGPTVWLRREQQLAGAQQHSAGKRRSTPHSRQATCHFAPRFGAKMAL